MAYCHRNFEESKTKLIFDKRIFKEMFGFSGWSFFNNSAFILNNQGVNMLMNIFFGVTVNAARGIALQVENSLLSFVNSFTTAVNPQITKSYAAGDLPAMHKLVCRGSKFSFFMMFILALPILLEAKQILGIWLVNVPDYTIIFVQLSLIMGLCDCMGSAGYTACMATGRIKYYSIIITSIAILEFPLAWIFFAGGCQPFAAYYTYIVVKIIVLVARMFLLKRMVGLNIGMYLQGVFLPVILVSLVASLLPIAVVNAMAPSLLRIIVTAIVSTVSASFTILYIGMTKNERVMIISKLGKVPFLRKLIKS
jgi:Na+-driven multidrug efflux pump